MGTIDEPILLCQFPVVIFQYAEMSWGFHPTQSVNVLMPNAGEIVGGSVRIWSSEEMQADDKREGIDRIYYYWYPDQRKYGICPPVEDMAWAWNNS